MDEDMQLQQMVDRLYDEAGQPDSRKLHICTKEGVGAAAVYGEVTTPESIFKALNISAEDKFVDLGSGRGQLVLAASMRLAGPRPQSSTGVELIDLRHEEAKKAWEKAGPIVQSTSTVKCGDALAEDVTTTTKAFICNQTFPADLNAAFCKALAPDKAPQLEHVATMRKLAPSQEQLGGLVLSRITTVKATYAPNGMPLYVYSRADAARNEQSGSTVVDTQAVQSMLEARRQADRMAMEQADAHSAGAAERGSLRTALMAASFMP